VGFEKFTADSYEEKRREANSRQLTVERRDKDSTQRTPRSEHRDHREEEKPTADS